MRINRILKIPQTLLSTVLLFISIACFSQDDRPEGIFNLIKEKKHVIKDTILVYKQDQTSLGVGLGLDYGGLGLNTTHFLTKSIGITAGIGIAIFEDIGWNIGAKYRFTSKEKRRTRFILFGLYGSNTIVLIEGSPELDRSFKGFSIGAGIDTKWRRGKLGYWSFEFLLPFKSKEVPKYVDFLNSSYGIEIEESPVRIALSIGYHFVLKKRSD